LETKKELHILSEKRKEARHKENMAIRAQFLQLLDARLKTIDATAQKAIMDCDIKSTQKPDSVDHEFPAFNQDSNW